MRYGRLAYVAASQAQLDNAAGVEDERKAALLLKPDFRASDF